MLMTGKPVNIFHLNKVRLRDGSSFPLFTYLANAMFVEYFRALDDIEEEVVILTNLFSSQSTRYKN